MISRMFSSLRSNMIIRSTPGAIPACGGAPNWNALYNAPNLSFNVSLSYPAMSNAFSMISMSWLRTAPDDNSTPLHTISYWYAKISNGSFSFNASNPPCGIENGLCVNPNLPVSSSISYIGKSLM